MALFSGHTARVVAIMFLASLAQASSGAQGDELASKAQIPDEMRDVAQAAADHFKAGEYDQAAAGYWAIIDQHPNSLYAWSNLGVTRFKQGQMNTAKEAFSKAVALAPRDALCNSGLGFVYYRLENYTKAIQYFEVAVKVNPPDPVSENCLGNCYLKIGLTGKGEAELMRARNLDR